MPLSPKEITTRNRGIECLNLIGRPDLVGQPTGKVLESGEPELNDDFLRHCGEKAVNAFKGLESLPRSTDPKSPFQLGIRAMNASLVKYFPEAKPKS